jgi:RNA polymerase sigma-70 factor, ECF subfamily
VETKAGLSAICPDRMESTSTSLLDQLQHAPDAVRWGRFVRLYAPLLYGWAHAVTSQEADAADLVQDVFTIVVQRLTEFRPQVDGSFRGWLRTILRNRWNEVQRKRRPVPAGNLEVLAMTVEPGLPDDGADQRALLSAALILLQNDFEPSTWKAFAQTALHGRPAAAVAADLHLSTDAVYVARSRVLQRLRRELAGLLD